MWANTRFDCHDIILTTKNGTLKQNGIIKPIGQSHIERIILKLIRMIILLDCLYSISIDFILIRLFISSSFTCSPRVLYPTSLITNLLFLAAIVFIACHISIGLSMLASLDFFCSPTSLTGIDRVPHCCGWLLIRVKRFFNSEKYIIFSSLLSAVLDFSNYFFCLLLFLINFATFIHRVRSYSWIFIFFLWTLSIFLRTTKLIVKVL
jgi:hypothetical protein